MTTRAQTTGSGLVVSVNDGDHLLGPPDAPVTLVEYGDYQSLYCAMAHPIVRELLRRRQGTLRFACRHFPPTNIHPYSETSAEPADAAWARRRFWPVHDWLFERQDRLDRVSLMDGLEELGLDGETIAEELRDHRYSDKVRSDFIGEVRSGVNGTPTFLVNGSRHKGGHTLPELEFAVDETAADAGR